MKRFIISTLTLLLLFSCASLNQKMIYGGARSSRYGIQPFPDPAEWGKMTLEIAKSSEASQPALIWIVGEIVSDKGKSLCRLNFPGEEELFEDIRFSTLDENEPYLDYFDKKGIEVFLQVEPGDADVETLISLVMSQYGHHRSVVGFGVDLEWYRIKGTDGWGTKADDRKAEIWEKKVRYYREDYSLFLKHWDARWLPPIYRGDIIFVNDSQGFSSLSSMKGEFQAWADRFYPNRIFIQTGYEADRSIWEEFDDPAGELSRYLTEDMKQQYGFFWVDFTLHQLF